MRINNTGLIPKIFTISFFILLFFVGFYVVDDYGANLDDEHYRQNGLLTYQYLKNLVLNLFIFLNFISETTLKNENLNIMEFTNPMFEVLLAFISDILNLKTTSKIYLLSHVLNFLIYFISLLFFFKLTSKIFKSSLYGFFSVIVLFFTPRIFAESFYNSRDIFFLSLFIFNIYTAYIFLFNQNIKNAILFSLTSAILIDVKIVGVLPVILFIFFYFLNSLTNKGIKNKEIKFILLIISTTFFFIFIFWPFLWSDPINNLIYIFSSIAEHHESTTDVMNLYLGKFISSNNAPWHYRIIWFMFTVPTFVLFFFITGYIYVFIEIVKGFLNFDKKENDIWKNKNEMFIFYLFTNIILIVFFTIKFSNIQFGGWRHIYFLYPLTIIFSLIGFKFIIHLSEKIIPKLFILLIVIANLFYIISWSYINHPHQQIFFNLMSKNYAIKNFDLDYWALSNLYSLKYILNNNENFPLKIGTISYSSLNESILMLNESSKKNIILVHDLDEADFLINNYMRRIRKNFIVDENKYLKYFEIVVDTVPINTVYKKIN